MGWLARLACALLLPCVLVSCGPGATTVGRGENPIAPFVTATATKGNAVRPPTPEDGADSLVGKPLPPFTMKLPSGATITQEATKGRVLVLGFWASWCAPCRQATQALEHLGRRFDAQGLVVIAANGLEEGPNDKAAALRIQKEHGSGVTFTVGNDQLMSAWGIGGVPYLLLVDRKGVVRYADGQWLPGSENLFAARIAKLLDEH